MMPFGSEFQGSKLHVDLFLECTQGVPLTMALKNYTVAKYGLLKFHCEWNALCTTPETNPH